jgi:hypothetical protein
MVAHKVEVDFPTSQKEAKDTGRTYFRCADPCPTCRTRFCWADTGKCMGCEPVYAGRSA